VGGFGAGADELGWDALGDDEAEASEGEQEERGIQERLVTLAFDEEDADAAAFLSQELPDCEAKSWAEVANKLVYVGSPFTVLQACAALEYERVNSTQSLNSFNRTLKANKKMLPQPNRYVPALGVLHRNGVGYTGC
jgi:hypothetical protein